VLVLTDTDNSGVSRVFRLSGRTRFLIGRDVDPEEHLHIKDGRLDSKHARVRCEADHILLEDLDTRAGTWVQKRSLRGADDPCRVEPGMEIQLGPDTKLTLEERSADSKRAAIDGLDPDTLHRFVDWCMRARRGAERELTSEIEVEDMSLDVCGTRIAIEMGRQVGPFVQTMAGVLAHTPSSPYSGHFPPSSLPIALPLVADLAALVYLPKPGIRRGAGSSRLKGYAREFLQPLADHIAVADVRERMRTTTNQRWRVAVATQFVARIFAWLEPTWRRLDAECIADSLGQLTFPMSKEQLLRQGKKAVTSEEYKTLLLLNEAENIPLLDEGEGIPDRVTLLRILQEAERMRLSTLNHRGVLDPQDVESFLWRISKVVSRKVRESIKNLDRFLLGAGTRVPWAFEDYNHDLVDACLVARDLPPERFKILPIRQDEHWPESLSKKPGSTLDIRRVRTTTNLQDLPEVIPQELATLLAGEDGPQIFLSKFMNQVLKWERRQLVREITRKRFLVCFIADISDTGQERSGSNQRGPRNIDMQMDPRPAPREGAKFVSASVHARRLIFDHLRDIGRFVDPIAIHLDLAIFLERNKDGIAEKIVWKLALDDLVPALDGDLFHFMIELEKATPGFFYKKGARRPPNGEDHHSYIEDALSVGGYELVLFVLMGPRARVQGILLPEDPPGDERHANQKTVVKLVHLARSPDRVEVATGSSFADVGYTESFELLADTELRLSVIEALLGPRDKQREEYDVQIEEGNS